MGMSGLITTLANAATPSTNPSPAAGGSVWFAVAALITAVSGVLTGIGSLVMTQRNHKDKSIDERLVEVLLAEQLRRLQDKEDEKGDEATPPVPTPTPEPGPEPGPEPAPVPLPVPLPPGAPLPLPIPLPVPSLEDLGIV